MVAITWTEPARKHFDEIIRDIALDSPEFARTVADNIAGNYRVIYVSLPGTVAIIAVIHGARAFRL